MEMHRLVILVVFLTNTGQYMNDAKPANSCKFGAKLNGNGKCVCPDISLCPKSNDVVCGSDAVTYGNACKLQHSACVYQQSIYVFKKGYCGYEGLPCPSIFCPNTPYCPGGRDQHDNGCIKCTCRSFQRTPCPSPTACLNNCASMVHPADSNGCPCICQKST